MYLKYCNEKLFKLSNFYNYAEIISDNFIRIMDDEGHSSYINFNGEIVESK